MFSSLLLVLICFGLLPSCGAEEDWQVPQSICLNHAARTATGYGKCNSMVSEMLRCNASASTNRPAARSCLCRQEIYNSIIECGNESNFCAGGNFDYLHDDIADQWHEKCKNNITFSLTTPVVSTYSSIDINACSTAWDGCLSQSAEFSKCKTFSAQSSQLTSCMCRPAVLSAAFTCSYYNNVSCSQLPGTLSEMYGYEYCTGFMGVVGPLANATPTNSRASIPTMTASLSLSKPAFPGSSQTVAGPEATKKSTSSAPASPQSALLVVPLAILILYLGLQDNNYLMES